MEQQIKERLVERRQSQKRDDGEHHGEEQEAGRDAHQNLAGRRRMMAMSSVNETSGAQVGAVTAMVSASLTPIRSPASSGPSALPRPPIMTPAKTTPIHA